jgi:hypothetical protein
LKLNLSPAKVLLSASAIASLAFSSAFLLTLPSVQAASNNAMLAARAIINRLSTSAPPAATGADVVTKALAFKALLTTSQQAVLEQTYTTTLARRWSNLPCGSGCRNGIQLSTLNAEQLAAALEVIRGV